MGNLDFRRKILFFFFFFMLQENVRPKNSIILDRLILPEIDEIVRKHLNNREYSQILVGII